MYKFFLLAFTFLLSACADYTQVENSPTEITCYSGGTVIFSGNSVGGVLASNVNRIEFTDKSTLKRVLIQNASCVVSPY